MLNMERGLKRIVLFIVVSTITVNVVSAGSPPKFKQPPVHDVVGLTDKSHKFKCRVSGFPKPLIVWYHGNKLLSQNNARITIRKYSMRIDNLQKADSGKYACKAFNKYGVIWGNFSLQVGEERITTAPIIKDMKNQTAMAGDNVTFTCEIVMSDSEPLLQWLRHFKNEKGESNVLILQSRRIQNTINESQILVLHNVTKDDQGWYTCLVSNTVGMNLRRTWLTVKGCETNNSACHTNATCEAGEGISNCKCKPGYTGDGQTCTMTGCETNNSACHTNATCEVGEGISNCKCKPGYTGDGHTCTMEGCETNNSACHTNATCEVGEAISNCKCKPGYTGDGHTCTNIDECSGAFYPCLRDYTCEDWHPGYFCAPVML